MVAVDDFNEVTYNESNWHDLNYCVKFLWLSWIKGALSIHYGIDGVMLQQIKVSIYYEIDEV